ncbi:hypothetical protein HDK90DRAFT_166309 [Phyllosticta capitalensis]|uniref:Uncharacterized protein n=1 Tax=Phyllosticta capitalensis TaxID=121624 RepID=A0ABR1Z266_9PEZI
MATSASYSQSLKVTSRISQGSSGPGAREKENLHVYFVRLAFQSNNRPADTRSLSIAMSPFERQSMLLLCRRRAYGGIEKSGMAEQKHPDASLAGHRSNQESHHGESPHSASKAAVETRKAPAASCPSRHRQTFNTAPTTSQGQHTIQQPSFQWLSSSHPSSIGIQESAQPKSSSKAAHTRSYPLCCAPSRETNSHEVSARKW